LKEGRITLTELADMHEILDIQDYFTDKEKERQEREKQKQLAGMKYG